MASTGLSTYAIEKFLKHAVGLSAWTMPTGPFVSQGHTADPGADGSANVDSGYQSFADMQPDGGSGNWYGYRYDFLGFTWTSPYWSIRDSLGNVLFVSRIADLDNPASNTPLMFYVDSDDVTTGSFKGVGVAAVATCSALPPSVTAGTLTGSCTATAEGDPARPIDASVTCSATASVGGSGSGTGYVSASIEATSFAQIGGSVPAVIEAFERRLSDVQVSMFVVG